MREFNQEPVEVLKGKNRSIFSFSLGHSDGNIDTKVVESFGDEWSKFKDFSEEEIDEIGKVYFDILDDSIINKNSYCIDVGCGTGRWSRYLSSRVGFIEAIDPSKAIFAADELLAGVENVRLSQASTDNIPFTDGTFDFGMSVGVLHHIPDTYKALNDCVKKIKVGGHFYVYLYYALDNRGFLFKSLFKAVSGVRKIISRMPQGLKKLSCDVLAVTVYMPVVLTGRFVRAIGFKSAAEQMPLSGYHDRSFFIIRNDALDRFGTKIEHRFTKAQVAELMERAGLSNVIVSHTFPYWHAVGKKLA